MTPIMTRWGGGLPNHVHYVACTIQENRLVMLSTRFFEAAVYLFVAERQEGLEIVCACISSSNNDNNGSSHRGWIAL